jgi:hypothetical protein
MKINTTAYVVKWVDALDGSTDQENFSDLRAAMEYKIEHQNQLQNATRDYSLYTMTRIA